MRPRRRFLPIVLLLFFAPFLWSLPPHGDEEVARVRRHLARAQRLAAGHDIRALTGEQQAARARNLALLESYRRAGIFPHNHDFPGRMVPCFRDRHGTLCAMGYLIDRSGRHDIVQAVASRMNYATVFQMAGDRFLGPTLRAWLRDHGLTLQEAQTIQPHYLGDPPWGEEEISPAYAAASASIGGFNVIATCMNAGAGGKPSPWWASLGIVTGFAQIGIGLNHMGGDHTSPALDWANLVVGTITTATGISTTSDIAHAKERERPQVSGLHVAPFCGFDDRAHPCAGVVAAF